MDWPDLVTRVVPILYFLVMITVVAELADRMGLFTALGNLATRVSRGRVLVLWLLLVVISVATTAVLSLDTTAVLITPVALALAKQHRLHPVLATWTCVWVANCASLTLPVANLTNLLTLSHPARHLTADDWLSTTWAPALVGVVVPLVVLAVRHRHDLRGRITQRPDPVERRGLVWAAGLVCAGLAGAFVLGAPVPLAAGTAALLLGVCCVVAAPHHLDVRILPWRTVIGVSVLFVVVTAVHQVGLSELVLVATGAGDDGWSLVRLAGVSALVSNVINNLPAYLALEPAADSVRRTIAVLVGTNMGPLVTPWASVATLLWADRCRAAGVPVAWGPLAGWGAVVAVLTVGLAVGATVLTVAA
ncbi:SLC13 family permease [Propionibacteriaceae bacterium Y2011]